MSQYVRKVQQAQSLGSLSTALRALAKNLPNEVSKLAIATSDTLAYRLINETPVDTSLALSNWRVGLVYPEIGAIPAHSVGEQGSTSAMSRAAAYMQAKAVLKTKKPSTAVYISNSAKHIVELNQGKSSQQPTPYWIQSIESEVAKHAELELRKLVNGN